MAWCHSLSLSLSEQTDDNDHRCCRSSGTQVKMNTIKKMDELQSVEKSQCVRFRVVSDREIPEKQNHSFQERVVSLRLIETVWAEKKKNLFSCFLISYPSYCLLLPLCVCTRVPLTVLLAKYRKTHWTDFNETVKYLLDVHLNWFTFKVNQIHIWL